MSAANRAVLLLLAVLVVTGGILLSSFVVQGGQPAPGGAAAPPVEVTPEPPMNTPSEPAATAGTDDPSAPEPTPEPVSEPEPEPTPEPEPEPAEDLTPLTADFFDDAAFLGDSISGTLEYYRYHNDGLGQAVFLVRVDYSVRAALDGSMMVQYKGKDMLPQNALAAAGVSKVYIMLGAMGDIASTGIDKTMDNWATLVSRIRDKCPGIRIFIQSCTPLSARGETAKLSNAMISEYNERLKTFAEENDCVYVAIGEGFQDEKGALPDKYCRDGYAHLRIDAGEYWAELLKDPANYSVSPYLA